MSRDRYKIEILHAHHPHLMWIKVRECKSTEDFSLHQVGLYGILPLQTRINVETNTLETTKCKNWEPAAISLIFKIISESPEIWFSPTFIDRRVSIFDDNIHKYGDVEYKSGNKIKSLSEKLIKSSLAYQDECYFHEKLSKGEIKTSISNTKLQDILKHFVNYFQSKGVPKKVWDKVLKSQMSVFFCSQQLESALTQSNLEKHNNLQLKSVLQRKMKDLNLCKDVDDESLGRAFHRVDESSETQISSDMLRRKLNHTKTNKDPETVETYNSIKFFFDNNSNSQIINGSEVNVKEKQNETHNVDENDNNKEDTPSLRFQKHNLNEYISTEEIHKSKECSRKKPVKKKKSSIDDKQHVMLYGPPGLNPAQFVKNVEPQQLLGNLPHHKTTSVSNDVDHFNMKVGEVESEINVDLCNKEVLEKILDVTAKANRFDNSLIQEGGSVGSCISYDTAASSSLLLQKRLRVGKRKDKDSDSNNSSIQNSEVSSHNRFAAENMSKQDDMSEDEVCKVMTRINEKYGLGSVSSVKENVSNEKLVNVKLKNHVNPFQNTDPNISIFVDKLVTPILMVHSKLNKRIEPVYEMRDVNFNSNIHLALQNMSIKLPMMVQSVSWFTILRGYSLFMISPMGSGKTIGYLPAVCSLVIDYSQTLGDSVGPIGIIVCATAESVTNVERAAKLFLNNERVVSCYAGVDDLDIAARLLNKCDLLICTPPALVRLLKAKELGVDLRRLCSFVLDDCERLAEVYVDEIKFFFIKITEMMKNRAFKELKVQFILASRVWCDFMRPLAKKVTDTVLCIGAFQECVLYSKANTSVSYVKPEDKINSVSNFLIDINGSTRTVVVCRADEEVKMLTAALKKTNKYIISCDTTMTVQDLYSLNISWTEYSDPLVGPLLICCDDNLTHMNITNAHNLIHYSLPTLFSMFCKRFSVLNDNYPSIFKNDCNNVNIKILLEETNIEQFPKIINFIKRCTDSVPDVLNSISEKVLIEKDARKAQQLVPICNNLLGFGHCPDLYNCQGRHTIFKEHDMPLEWLHNKGTIAFKILHYQSAISYSARLLSNTLKGVTTKYHQTYNLLSMKMSMYYSKESNRKLHGIPELGDICAVSMKQNFFVRCQVLKILNRYEKGNPNYVLVNLIDEEKLEVSRDIYLYYMPDEMKNIRTGTVRVRLANIQPLDKDITFSELALKHVRKIIESDEDLYLKGNICLIISNTIFIDDLEVCEDLTSLNKTVVKCNIIQELLGKHAKSNIDHIVKLRNMCVSSGIKSLQHSKEPLLQHENKVLTKANWAYLDIGDISCIYFNSAISPDSFFIRLDKFVSCMTDLTNEIQEYVKNNMIPLTKVAKGDLVLAKFPDDGTFERGRVDELLDNDKIKCFFVDYGDWRDVPVNHLVNIPEKYIKKLPFQAIECRLIGTCPPGQNWSDFSINWLWDNCLEDVNGKMKPLYVKYLTQSQAEFTGGKKYNVVLVDTNTDEDVVINKLMIDLNLAREHPEEIHYLRNLDFKVDRNDTSDSVDEDNDEWEKVSMNNSESNTCSHPFMEKPIRTVPLVGSDEESDDSDRWNIHMAEEFREIFKPAFQQMMKEKQHHLSAIETNENNFAKDNSENDEINILVDRLAVDKNEPVKTTELDSDDLTSTLSSKSDRNSDQSSQPNFITSIQELRRPRVVWQQSKKNVNIKIQLIVEGDYELIVESRKIIFKAKANDTTYGFIIELYAVVDTRKCYHSNKGQYILIKLNKMLSKKWLFLTKDGTIKKWITYDFDSIDTSSDEEVFDGKPMENIIKSSHYGTESESDGDEIIDDANFIYKK